MLANIYRRSEKVKRNRIKKELLGILLIPERKKKVASFRGSLFPSGTVFAFVHLECLFAGEMC